MYERQVADNRQNAREQREWESPENQMKLLKQAGLNPDLMYGGLNSGSGIMPQSGSVGSVGSGSGFAGTGGVSGSSSAISVTSEDVRISRKLG